MTVTEVRDSDIQAKNVEEYQRQTSPSDGSNGSDSKTASAGGLYDCLLKNNVKLEVLCGVTVSLAQVPEAVAFALLAGLSPAIGVNSAWIIGTLTAILGGRPAMICGATGALAVVVPDLVKDHGVEYLFYAVILMGIMQMVLALLKAGSLIKMIPGPVMMGFCNGLALVIGLAQFNSFKKIQKARRLGGSFGAFTAGTPWIEGKELAFSLVICVAAFLVCIIMPKLTKKVPSALTAIVLCTIFEHLLVRLAFDTETATVKDASEGGVGGSFPIPIWADSKYNNKIPELNGETFNKIIGVSCPLAAIGLLESLMTLNLIDDITETKGSPTRECLAQGFANLICGALGGMGGCAMIGQSMINIGSGARNRISSVSAGIFLLIIVLILAPVIDLIPIAALAGVMFNVVYHTFEWSSLKLIGVAMLPSSMRARFLPENSNIKIRRVDAFVIVLVTVVTLFTDLAVAVGCGTVLSCLIFAWESAETIAVSRTEQGKDGNIESVIYDVDGVLFFGSTKKFLDQFDPKKDPGTIYVAFHAGMISDFSAIECLNQLAERYAKEGKTIVLQKLKAGCLKSLRKAGTRVSDNLTYDVVETSEELPKTQHHHLHVESFSQGGLPEIMPELRKNGRQMSPEQAATSHREEHSKPTQRKGKDGGSENHLDIEHNVIGANHVTL